MTDAQQNVVGAYAYDAFNRRVVEDGRQLVYNTGWEVLEERDAATGQVLVRNVWSPVYIDAMILRDRDANGVANDAGGSADNAGLEERVYVLQDANFNVTAVTDEHGTVLERYAYDPYGTRTVLEPDFSPDADGISDVAMTQGHQGGRHVSDAYGGAGGGGGGGGQAIDFRHRTLLSRVGTWNRQDPAGYVDGASLLQFNVSNPTVYLDPYGLARGRPLATTNQPSQPPPYFPTDHTQPPGDGWTWSGKGEPGSNEGAWVKGTRPDLQTYRPHLGSSDGKGHGDHYDYAEGGKNRHWRHYPDDTIEEVRGNGINARNGPRVPVERGPRPPAPLPPTGGGSGRVMSFVGRAAPRLAGRANPFVNVAMTSYDIGTPIGEALAPTAGPWVAGAVEGTWAGDLLLLDLSFTSFTRTFSGDGGIPPNWIYVGSGLGSDCYDTGSGMVACT